MPQGLLARGVVFLVFRSTLMQHKKWIMALVFVVCGPALADEAGDVAARLSELRTEIAQMKASYEQRIAALEAQLAEQQAETQAAQQARSPGLSSGNVPAAQGGATAFNPEVSLILQGAYKARKKVEEPGIGGFARAGGHDHGGEGHDAGQQRGFTLDHTELVLAANIDNRFRGQTTIALIDNEAELEEAWFQTLGLGNGLGLKAGRFFSGIGYQNEQHAHQWDFYEQPLMYQALFGEHGYIQDGVQAKWVAPAEIFIELGAEAGRGGRFPGSERNRNGANSHALFAHIGGDLGASHSWRAGLSWLRTQAEDRESHFESDPHGEVHGAFSGKSRVWLADLVYKWAPDGNPRNRNFKFQAEYFQRRELGRLGAEDEDGNDLGEAAYRTRQSGYYVQGVYQFTPNWRAGLRHERLDSGRQHLGENPAGIETLDYRPRRAAFMVEHNWSEFSRLRLQFARDRSLPGITDNQVTLQYIMSLGSHGAHKF
jgi:Sec-independent protein translocase protein TatA